MGKKHSTPALYEVIHGRMNAPAPPKKAPEPPPPPPTPPPTARKPEPEPRSPGWRVMRVPIGYIWIAVAMVIIVVVVSYTIGHSQGDKAAKSRFGEQANDTLLAGANGAEDPLNKSGSNSGVSGEKTPPDRPKVKGSDPNQPKVKPDPKPPKPPAGDDRTIGLNYFVIEQSSPAGAKTLAEFCQSSGLDARVVRDNNGVLRKVIVVPGFPYAERETKAIKDLESKIRSVGKAWQKQAPGNSDLSSTFIERFKG